MPKNTFSIISEEKRERIFKAAADAFARDGYANTNIKDIAKNAGISKGSIYDYFENKEDLYLSVCTNAINESRLNIDSVIDEGKDFFEQIEDIFLKGFDFVVKNPQYIQLYVNVSSCGMEQFAEKLTLKVEKHTADYYKAAIKRGIDDGVIRPNIDVNMASFLINNMYVIMMISLVSRHYRIRLCEYLEIDDKDVEADFPGRIEQFVDIIRYSLENRKRI